MTARTVRALWVLPVVVLVNLVAPHAARAEEGPYVTVAWDLHSAKYDGQEYIAVYCEGTSSAGMSGKVITETGVICSINGIEQASIGAGTKAVSVGLHPMARPAQFCYQGKWAALGGDAGSSERKCFTY